MKQDIKLLKWLLGYYAPSSTENEYILGDLLTEYIMEIDNPLHSGLDVYQDEYGNVIGEVYYGDEDITVGINAHIDTVPHTETFREINFENGIFTATNIINGKKAILGADDRAGVFSVLRILESGINGFKGKLKFFLTTSEEIGMVGASRIHASELDVDMMFVFDRRGSNDAVVACTSQSFCGKYFEDYLLNISDYVPVVGGYSDAVVFSGYGIPSVNISVGYYKEHTTDEHLVYDELINAIEFAKSAIGSLTESNVDRIVFEDYTTNKVFEKDKENKLQDFMEGVTMFEEDNSFEF